MSTHSCFSPLYLLWKFERQRLLV